MFPLTLPYEMIYAVLGFHCCCSN